MHDHEKHDPLVPAASIAPVSTTTLTTATIHTLSAAGAGAQEEAGCWLKKECCEVEGRGPRAYLTVFGGFLALFVTFGQMNAFGTFQTWYSNHQLDELSQSTISWIGSLQLLVFFLSGAPIGHCFDTYGPTGLLATGSVIFTLSLVLTSISVHYWHYILAQGLLFGLGVAFIFYPALASITTYFTEYRATALGIAAAGSSVGGVVYPIMLQHLFEKVGFAWGVRVSALVSGVGCLLVVLTVSNNASWRPRQSGPYIDLMTFRDPRFSLLALGSCFVALGLYIPFFYIAEYANHHLHLPSNLCFYMLSIMNAGGIFGRIAPAYISDSIGHFNLLTPAAFFSGLAILVLWLPAKSAGGLVVFAGVYGFVSGAFVSVLTPCVVCVSEVGMVGTRLGMLYSVISVPSLLGNPAAGALFALHDGHSFVGMIVFSGCTVLVGSVGILGARIAVERRVMVRV